MKTLPRYHEQVTDGYNAPVTAGNFIDKENPTESQTSVNIRQF